MEALDALGLACGEFRLQCWGRVYAAKSWDPDEAEDKRPSPDLHVRNTNVSLIAGLSVLSETILPCNTRHLFKRSSDGKVFKITLLVHPRNQHAQLSALLHLLPLGQENTF